MEKILNDHLLPVEIVFHQSWWNKHANISFDRDYFFHPAKRVEDERKMEKVLYDYFGNHGLGADKDKDLPVVGAIHNASGYLISEMLGCEIDYKENSAPQVIPANREDLKISLDDAFNSSAFKDLEKMMDTLKAKYGYTYGDVNWSGILNLALDLQGENLFLKFYESPGEVRKYFSKIAAVIEKFVEYIQENTGTSSISVNRNVRHFSKPVFLHSECSHTMIDNQQYEQLLLPLDIEWSKNHRPYGIHYCGNDPHRFAEEFAKIPYLDFLDVGWGGDLKILRHHLPNTFLNIRLDPVKMNDFSVSEVEENISRLVKDAGDPYLTGVCCINMDDQVKNENVKAIFDTVNALREEYR